MRKKKYNVVQLQRSFVLYEGIEHEMEKMRASEQEWESEGKRERERRHMPAVPLSSTLHDLTFNAVRACSTRSQSHESEALIEA